MLNSVDDVIEALGGATAVATLTEVGVSAVSNWRKRGIAPDKFFLVSQALKSKGLDVSLGVFAFKTEARA